MFRCLIKKVHSLILKRRSKLSNYKRNQSNYTICLILPTYASPLCILCAFYIRIRIVVLFLNIFVFFSFEAEYSLTLHLVLSRFVSSTPHASDVSLSLFTIENTFGGMQINLTKTSEESWHGSVISHHFVTSYPHTSSDMTSSVVDYKRETY